MRHFFRDLPLEAVQDLQLQERIDKHKGKNRSLDEEQEAAQLSTFNEERPQGPHGKRWQNSLDACSGQDLSANPHTNTATPAPLRSTSARANVWGDRRSG